MAGGFQIFEKADSNAAGNLIGIIKSVTSNSEAYLTTVSAYPFTNRSFRFYDTNTDNKSKIFKHQWFITRKKNDASACCTD